MIVTPNVTRHILVRYVRISGTARVNLRTPDFLYIRLPYASHTPAIRVPYALSDSAVALTLAPPAGPA